MMVEVEANLSFIRQIQSSLLYVTQLLTALQSLQCPRDCSNLCNVAAIAYNCMRSHAIACDLCDVDAISKKTFLSTTVRVLENTPGMRSGTESLPEVFLHNNCEHICYHYFFSPFSKRRNEKRDSFYTANVFPGRKNSLRL
jgi:hypothetical protein